MRVARDDEFLKPYPDLKHDMVEHPELFGNLPVLDIKGKQSSPQSYISCKIDPLFLATYNPAKCASRKWSYSSVDENPWWAKAKGTRVFAFPIWLYCDDTSGNLSKKWNAHNSFLFTPAGLPREEA